MKVKIQDYSDVTVVELQGELDGDAAELLQSTITEIVTKRKTGVVLDMSDMGYIDSRGLELLL